MEQRLCLVTARDAALAGELMQETFYQTVKCMKCYDGSCKMSVWLCQITKYQYFDYLKKQKYYQKVNLDEWMTFSIQPGTSGSFKELQLFEKYQIEIKAPNDGLLLCIY